MSAMLKHRRYTLPCYTIRISSIMAALALVALNCKQYYIGSGLSGPENEDTERFGGLLFAAKLHEFFMLASLRTAVLIVPNWDRYVRGL